MGKTRFQKYLQLQQRSLQVLALVVHVDLKKAQRCIASVAPLTPAAAAAGRNGCARCRIAEAAAHSAQAHQLQRAIETGGSPATGYRPRMRTLRADTCGDRPLHGQQPALHAVQPTVC